MDVLEKFRDGLSPEAATELEESIKAIIEDKAKVRADFLIEEEKLRLEELAEEFCKIEVEKRLEESKKELESEKVKEIEVFKETATEKLQEMADKYVEKTISEEVGKKVAELERKSEKKLEELEESILTSLDKFLDMEISSKISDSLLKEIAVNEAFKPIVNGIFGLFESHLVGLDTDGSKVISEKDSEIESLKKQVNEGYDEKLKLHEKCDKLQTAVLIASKVDGLSGKQKKRVVEMFEGKSYDEVKSKIDTFVEVLNESEVEIDSSKGDKRLNEDFEVFSDMEKETSEEKVVIDDVFGANLDWEKISNKL